MDTNAPGNDAKSAAAGAGDSPAATPGTTSPNPPAKPLAAAPEEYDRARWTLPPLLSVLVVAAVAALFLFLYVHHASRARAQGKLLSVNSVAVPGDTRVLVAINLSVQNLDQHPLWIRDVKVQTVPLGAKTGDAPLQDSSAPTPDVARYLQGFPALAIPGAQPLQLETRIPAGGAAQGFVVVAFPVSKSDFDQRKSLRVTLYPDNNAPFTLQ